MCVIKKIVLLLIVFIPFQIHAQVDKNSEYVIIDQDTIAKIKDTVFLKEVQIIGSNMTAEERKLFQLLQARVYKTYPFAKTASDRLVSLDKNINSLKNSKDKKRYLKLSEEYIKNEFEPKLKKLSRKQGQILVKLIHRQTGITTFDLIKNYKSGWKAFWSNNTAKLFDIDLKKEYVPNQINEDYHIETILQRAFQNGRLIEQKSANTFDLDVLDMHWLDISNKEKKK